MSSTTSTTDSTTNAAQCPYPSLESVKCPYPIFDRLRKEPVHQREPGSPEFIISTHEDITHVLRHPEIFSSTTKMNAEAQPGWEESVFSSDPPSHTIKREIAHHTLKPARMKEHQPMIQGIIDGLIDHFIDDGEVEFVGQFANLMSSEVMFRLLDIPREIGGWVADITFEGIGARYLPAEMQAQQEADGLKLNEFMTQIVTERVDNLGDDAISHLILGHRERKGEDDIAYVAVESTVLLLGGVLTTAHLTGNAMRLLLEHPDQMAAVRADHKLIPNMLEESMRVEAPLQFMPRVALEDTEVGGVAIARGTELLLIYASGNRDDALFPDAEEFDITRKNVRRHLGFGLGPHFCLGAPLARLEGKLAYETILNRMDNIAFKDGKDDGSFIKSAFNRGPKTLKLTFDKVA
jgi:cytochrome P450